MRSKLALTVLLAMLAFDSGWAASRYQQAMLMQTMDPDTAGPHTPVQPVIRD
jgi:hypothetical protein